ncbi:MAG: HAD family hydrolase, partial [Anaerolineae bacterium]
MTYQTGRITAVLFDLDDTLIDWSERLSSFAGTARPHVNNLYNYLTAEGHTMPEREILFEQYNQTVVQGWDKAKKTWAGVNFGRVLINTFIRLGLDVTRIDLDAAMHAFDWQPAPGVRPYADTHTVLQALKEKEYKIGLVTNSMYPMWMRDVELEAYGMLDYFDARVTSGDTGYM